MIYLPVIVTQQPPAIVITVDLAGKPGVPGRRVGGGSRHIPPDLDTPTQPA